jgi:hypothetical protein
MVRNGREGEFLSQQLENDARHLSLADGSSIFDLEDVALGIGTVNPLGDGCLDRALGSEDVVEFLEL